MMRILAWLAPLLFLSACGGYHFTGTGGSLPGDVKVLYVDVLDNKTSEPRLGQILTNQVRTVLSRNSLIELTEQRDEADGVLRGEITRYSSGAVAYDKNDDISRYRASLTLDVELVNTLPENEILWEKTLTRSHDYVADNDKLTQEDLEEAAVEKLSQRLSEDLYDQLFNDF